jgi:hypothetical protein
MKDVNVHQTKQSSEELACQLCDGIFEHAAWCATREPRVSYAYRLVADASAITLADSLILHSLGVAWANPPVI